jgi:nucleoside-diphosphate-sugar epimerase
MCNRGSAFSIDSSQVFLRLNRLMSNLSFRKIPNNNWIVESDVPMLVTGAGGFIGSSVVRALLAMGYVNLRCFVRPSSSINNLRTLANQHPNAKVEIITGNLLSPSDCQAAVKGVKVIFHLVTGRGKSFPACFQNSVVSTRNLLEAALAEGSLMRFVNVSSFAVYSNFKLPWASLWDETCSLEDNLEDRFDAYVYAKLKQDELVEQYARERGLKHVTVRPPFVIGPGKRGIPGCVGIDTFGVFFHLGGGNRLPLTYVDNCADAIALAGLVPGVEGQVFNVVDDDLPASRSFLRQYKAKVRNIRSIPIPYTIFYFLCYLWERYAKYSEGQLPPVFNRRDCAFSWKGHRYSNRKLKELLGWKPLIPMQEALDRYFDYQRNGGSRHA